MMFSRFSKPHFLASSKFHQILAGLILLGTMGSVGYSEPSQAATEMYPQAKTDLQRSITSNRLLSTQVTDVVIVDGGVTNPDALLKTLPSQAAVHLIDSEADGLDQISDILKNYRHLKAVHLISHGSAAQLHLGNSRVTSTTLHHKAGQIQQWQDALSPSADIFLYGCNVASTTEGQEFVAHLATLTSADVAASDNPTGNAAQGGDWTLEYELGELEPHVISQQLAQSNYSQLLQVTVLNFNDPTPTLEPTTTNVFRFQNVATVGGQSVDALVTVSNINNATLTTLDDNGSFPDRFQPVIRHDGGANTISSIQFDFQLVQAGTQTPLAATNVFFSAQDVDGNGAANAVREFVEVIGADTVFIDDPTLLELITPVAGGIRHRILNSSNVQNGIGTDDRYEIYSYLGDTVSTFTIVAGNDVGSADCSGASCPRQNSWTFDISDIQIIDFSDAPSDYGVPSHAGTTATALRLGAARDGDNGPIPSANALGDDNNGAPDDEDGVTLAPLNASDTSYSIQASSLSVANSTGGPATLHAWVDFDGNGTFDPDEYASQTVQSGNSSPDGALTWSGAGVSGLSGGTTTYARFRLTTDGDVNASMPGGFAQDGEVEDYALAIALPTTLPPRSCPNGTGTLNWSAFEPPNTPNWPNGSLGPQQFTVNGVQYTIEFKNPNNHSFTDTSPRVDSASFTDNNGNPALYYRPNMTTATPDQYIEIHITMRDPGTGNLLPITGFQGVVDDVDQNNSGGTWQDEVVLTGYLGGTTGTAYEPTLVANNPSNVRVIGNVASGITINNFPTGGGPGASVDYGFGNQSVDTLVIRYRPGPDTPNHSSAQHTTLNNWSFCLPVTNNPNVLLVKRITRVNGLATNGSTALNAYIDDPLYPYDDNTLNNPIPTPVDTEFWPTPNTFLLGATNGGETRPGDEIEYTIYFLSTGNTTAVDVQLCDKVPSFQAFVPNAFNSIPPAPSGGVGANRGISVEYNGSLLSFTNDADGDTAQYYPPGSALPSACSNAPAQSEDNGAIVVNLGNLPQATSSGTPSASYGSIRFRATVK